MIRELRNDGHEVYIGQDWSGIDICLLLGDRYETGFAAMYATFHRIPIVHVHGGERTFGSFDNQIRDAVTKLAHVHCVAHDHACRRVICELGESPQRVHVTGAPGLDNVARVMGERSPERENEFLLTWHPPTLGDPVRGLQAILRACGRFPDYRVVWTGVNADPGCERVMEAMKDYEAVVLPPDDYLRRARAASLLIGNSSSHIIEGPGLRTPTVDIGDRQSGRLSGDSVFHAGETADQVAGAIVGALGYKGTWDNPYGGPGASRRIADVIGQLDLEEIRRK